jgi:Subtilase family
VAAVAVPPPPAAAIVTMLPGARIEDLGPGARRLWPGSRVVLVRPPGGATAGALRRLTRQAGVAAVAPDRERRDLGVPDPLLDRQPHLATIHWTPPAPTGRRPLVAVLDTGVDARAPDLAGVVVTGGARSFVPGSPDALLDREGHGTHVAGILGAVTDNGIGGAGVAAVRLLPIKIADRTGTATTSSLVRGLHYAVSRGARVINVSFGGSGYSPLEQEAIDEAVRAGALVVAAAGNTGGDGSARQYPGAYRHVLAVGAVGPDEQPLPGSTRGPQVAISAPGADILSTAPGDGAERYLPRTGTSMATAMVSGAAARLLAGRPWLRADQVRTILTETARDVAPPGWDPATGAGILDLAAALAAPEAAPDGAEPDDDPVQAAATRPLLRAGAASGHAGGRATAWSDPRDDYRVTLAAGDRLKAALSGPPDADFDLVLWRPRTPGFRPGAAFARQWLAAGSVGPGTSETLRFTAPVGGVYSLEVRVVRGDGPYRLAADRVSS